MPSKPLLIERLRQHLLDNPQLLPYDHHLVIALSGGADSVALLLLLKELQQFFRWELCAYHLDHQWRPCSKEDALFCQELCQNLKVPLHLRRHDLSKATSNSIEALGRQVRYRELSEIAQQHPHHRIVTAHHLDDQAETLLLRLLRGTSLQGLAGCLPLREDQVARPLLPFTKQDLLNYLDQQKQSWREDPTNHNQRPRAQIRHRLLPLLRQDFNPQIDTLLYQLSQQALQWKNDLPELLAHYPDPQCQLFSSPAFDKNRWKKLPDCLQEEFLRHWFTRHLEHLPPMEYSHFQELDRWVQSSQSNQFHHLPASHQLYCWKHQIALLPKEPKAFSLPRIHLKEQRRWGELTLTPKQQTTAWLQPLKESPKVKSKKFFQKWEIPPPIRAFWPVFSGDFPPFLWGEENEHCTFSFQDPTGQLIDSPQKLAHHLWKQLF